MVVVFTSMAASAQFMVVTTYDSDQEETMDQLTARLGVGYMVTDGITAGIVRGDKDDAGDDTYELFARYNLGMLDGAYAMIQMPTEDMTDNMKVGIGMSFAVWNSLYLEPNYTKSMKDGEKGQFNIALSYLF